MAPSDGKTSSGSGISARVADQVNLNQWYRVIFGVNEEEKYIWLKIDDKVIVKTSYADQTDFLNKCKCNEFLRLGVYKEGSFYHHFEGSMSNITLFESNPEEFIEELTVLNPNQLF